MSEKVTDWLDAASNLDEQLRSAGIAASANYRTRAVPTGHCLNYGCDETPEAGQRWCCPECRDDWQKRNPNV